MWLLIVELQKIFISMISMSNEEKTSPQMDPMQMMEQMMNMFSNKMTEAVEKIWETIDKKIDERIWESQQSIITEDKDRISTDMINNIKISQLYYIVKRFFGKNNKGWPVAYNEFSIPKTEQWPSRNTFFETREEATKYLSEHGWKDTKFLSIQSKTVYWE